MNRGKVHSGRAAAEFLCGPAQWRQRSAIYLVALLLSAGECFAGIVRIPPGEGEATMRIPADWSVKVLGELTQAISPDQRMHFVIVPVEHRKTAEAIGEVMRYMRNSSGVGVAPSSLRKESRNINGHDARLFSWTGTANAESVEIRFIVFAVKPNEVFVVAYWGSRDALETNRSKIERVLNSIGERD